MIPSSLFVQAFYYPEDAGLAFGGPSSSKYLRLEVHYHNPLQFEGEQDTAVVGWPLESDPEALGIRKRMEGREGGGSWRGAAEAFFGTGLDQEEQGSFLTIHVLGCLFPCQGLSWACLN